MLNGEMGYERVCLGGAVGVGVPGKLQFGTPRVFRGGCSEPVVVGLSRGVFSPTRLPPGGRPAAKKCWAEASF